MKKLLVLVLLLFNSCFINREENHFEDSFIDSIYRRDWMYIQPAGTGSIYFNRNGDFDVRFVLHREVGLANQEVRMELVEVRNNEQAYYRFYYTLSDREVGPLYVGVSHGWTELHGERVLFFTDLYDVPYMPSYPDNRDRERWLRETYSRYNLDFRRGNAFARRGYRASSEDAKKAVFIKPS